MLNRDASYEVIDSLRPATANAGGDDGPLDGVPQWQPQEVLETGHARDVAAESASAPATAATRAPYQVMPNLTPEDYQALKANIQRRGIQAPVLIDEEGNILDGHHRRRIADELGIDCPHETRSGLTHAERTDIAVALNVTRRHLTADQKRSVIDKYLTAAPEKSDREIAKATGADPKTVGRRRREMESTEEIPQLEERVGGDGKARKSPKAPKASASSPKGTPTTPAGTPSAGRLPKPAEVVEQFQKDCLDIKQLRDGNKLTPVDGHDIAVRAVSLLRLSIDTLRNPERQKVVADLKANVTQHECAPPGTPEPDQAPTSATEASEAYDELPADQHGHELEGHDNDGL